MRFLAALLLCLAGCTAVAAKPSRIADQFHGDRYSLMLAQGMSGEDVGRAMRCPAPLTRDCRRPRKVKQKIHRHERAKVAARSGAVIVPLPRVRPEMDDEQAAAYRWIAMLLAGGKVYVRPAALPAPSMPPVRKTLLGGLAREIGEALPPTLGGYLASLFRPIGNCREFETVDPRVKTIVADAARHFGGPALMTSCYRSAAYNRMVYARMGRRATRSLHIAHKAVDFKIAGVSKFELAKYLRRHRLAGGVGLYCNSIVHIDVGRRRSWNWCAGTKRTRFARHRHRHYASAR